MQIVVSLFVQVNAILTSIPTPSTSFPVPAEKQLYVEALRSASSGEIFARFAPNHGLRFLAGEDIAPGCSYPPPLRNGNAESLAVCYFSTNRALLDIQGEDPANVAWSLSWLLEEGNDGIGLFRIDQVLGSVRVKNGGVRFAVKDGKLIEAAGVLVPPSMVPTGRIAPSDDALVQSQIEILSGLAPLNLVDRYFDPALQTLVSTYSSVLTPGQLVVYDELTSVYESIPYPVGHATRQTTVGTFANGWGSNGSQTVDVSTPVTGCIVTLDWGSAYADGSPKVVRDSSSAVTETNCGMSVFTGYSSQTYKGLQANAYFWNHDLGEFSNHWRAAYDNWYAWIDPRPLEVDVLPTATYSGGSSGLASDYGTYHRIELDGAGANDLATMTHEYGHHLAYMYGNPISGSFHPVSVDEGFAEHNILRYAMFRHREDSIGPTTPFQRATQTRKLVSNIGSLKFS